MSVFSTRNHDGASGLGEPINTIPAHDWRGLQRDAARHSCATVGESITAAGPRGRGFGGEKPADLADRN